MPRRRGSPKRLPTTIPTSEQSLDAYSKAVRCLELRREGHTWRDIAQMVGYKSQGSAHEAVQRLLKRVARETDDTMREVEKERLDEMTRRLHDLIFGNEAKGVEASDRMAARNIEVAVKVMERRAKLFGLDAADRTEITVQAPKVIEYVRDERQDVRARAVAEVLEGDYEELAVIEQRYRDLERESLPEPRRQGEAPGSADPGDAE